MMFMGPGDAEGRRAAFYDRGGGIVGKEGATRKLTKSSNNDSAAILPWNNMREWCR